MSTKMIEFSKKGYKTAGRHVESGGSLIETRINREIKKHFKAPVRYPEGFAVLADHVPECLTRAITRKSSRFCCVARTDNFSELLLSCKSRQAVLSKTIVAVNFGAI
jgi:hypothetical protein